MAQPNTIYIRLANGRLGNILFYIAYKMKYMDKLAEIKFYSPPAATSTKPTEIKKAFKKKNNIKRYIETYNNTRKIIRNTIPISFYIDKNNHDKFSYNDILNPHKCDFNKLKEVINFEYLDSLNKTVTEEKYLCIHCRYGDYLENKYKDTYKAFDGNVFSYILNKYPEIVKEYKNVVVISDNISLAKLSVNNTLNKYGFEKITYSDGTTVDDLNYLINADCIIGSCSTFSFIGYYLNKNNAKMYVEYPYYKTDNSLNFNETKQHELYDSDNIIKISI